MRRIFIGFFSGILILLSCSSCIPDLALLLIATGGERFDDEDPLYHYCLSIEFVDAEDGHNLIKGIPLKNDYYVDESQYEFEVELQSSYQLYGVAYNHGFMQEHDNVTMAFGLDNPSEMPLTYSLTCPYIFGDDAPHKLSVYFEENKYYPRCLKMETDDHRFGSWQLDEEENYVIVQVNPSRTK